MRSNLFPQKIIKKLDREEQKPVKKSVSQNIKNYALIQQQGQRQYDHEYRAENKRNSNIQ